MANFSSSHTVGSMASFNVNDGFLEGILRGYRKGILTTTDYSVLGQCDTLEDLKLYLCNNTAYGEKFLQHEAPPLQTSTIAEHATRRLVEEFEYLRDNSVEPLCTFLDYITYAYQIDNIVLLISGTLRGRDSTELLAKCHPLGMFEAMETITIAQSVSELYRDILVDTKLAPYFKDTLKEADLSELNIEIIRNTLFRAYLEDFYAFTQQLGGTTAKVMGELLSFEADRRSITITINSIGTELSRDDREKLYPSFGLLYPEGTAKLADADELEQVRAACAHINAYRDLLSNLGNDEDARLDAAFFEYEAHLNVLSFEEGMHYGVFYSYVKLIEQQTRNITWVSECIAQHALERISQYIKIF